jgi:hypothetical protein
MTPIYNCSTKQIGGTPGTHRITNCDRCRAVRKAPDKGLAAQKLFAKNTR